MTFTHLDADRHPAMVDVSDKTATKRTATAETRVRFRRLSLRHCATAACARRKAGLRYGDRGRSHGREAHARTDSVLSPAWTGELPHYIDLDGDTAVIRCTVSVHHKTGVEMEALTGASIAALTVYDMCKALSPRHRHRRLAIARERRRQKQLHP